MSSLQLHVQLVHLGAAGGRLRRAPRGGGGRERGSPHNLLGEAHGSVTNSETDLSTATKPRSQEDGRNRSVAFTSTAVFTPTLLADRSASFTVVTRVS